MQILERDAPFRGCNATRVGALLLPDLTVQPNSSVCAVVLRDAPNSTFQSSIAQCCNGTAVTYADSNGNAVPSSEACVGTCDIIGVPLAINAIRAFNSCLAQAGYTNVTLNCGDSSSSKVKGAGAPRLGRPGATSSLLTLGSVLFVLPLAVFVVSA